MLTLLRDIDINLTNLKYLWRDIFLINNNSYEKWVDSIYQ